MAEKLAKAVLTSRDIATICGVSQSTVSRVLSGHPNVSAKTREAVTEVLRQTSFVPNASAQAMRTQRTRSIGVVVGTPVNLYGTEVMSQVHEHAARHGLRLSVWLADQDGHAPDALQALRERSVDGLIYTTAVDPMPSLEAEIATGAPIVLMSRIIRGAGTDIVAGANVQGGRRMAAYLAHHSRRRIALIGGHAFSPGREIEQGFRKGLDAAGVRLRDDDVLLGDMSYEFGMKSLDQLWSRATRPDTIFCVNDMIAYGILDAARLNGVSVPNDLWVAGYNDITMSDWASYELTTVRQPIDRMAEISVDLLMKRISRDGPPSPVRKRLKGTLMIRRSTANAPSPA